MSIHHTRRQDTCRRIRSRKTPLATCLAAAMALSMSGPLMAYGNDAESARVAHHSLLLHQGQSSGSVLANQPHRSQTDIAETAMQRFLGIQAPSIVTGATIPVSNCNDAGAGSLRAAVDLASSGDTIDVSGISCTVELASSIVTSADDLTIQGNPDAKYNFTISGKRATVPLQHFGTGTLTLSAVTVASGLFTTGLSTLTGSGGCIYSKGDVTLTDSTQVKFCKAEHTGGRNASGGAIYSAGVTAVFSGSVVTGGRAIAASGNALGGGIYAKGGVAMKYGLVTGNSAITTTGSITRGGGIYAANGLFSAPGTISNNTASGGSSGLNVGGGAWVTGPTTIGSSTVSGNTADTAAALALGHFGTDDIEISQSTIANNEAVASGGKYGGAVYLGNTSVIKNCTITGNIERNSSDTKYGAGLLIKKDVSLDMSSTIVSGNVLIDESDIEFPSDIRGSSTTPAAITGYHNLVGVVTSATVYASTIRTSDPKLGPLQDNGGPTLTTAVLKGSPAIRKGDANGYTTDQRGTGFKRIYMFTADIGAYELGGDTIFANGFNPIPL